jgi:hypothetical protein
LKHKTGLRQGAFGGVNQQDGAINHRKGPLHFAAEIGMARGVHDVDFNALVDNGAIFGGNGDAAFALQIHAVHDPFIHLLALAKQAALTKHGIHQGGFTMVNVGDNGDVAKLFIC